MSRYYSTTHPSDPTHRLTRPNHSYAPHANITQRRTVPGFGAAFESQPPSSRQNIAPENALFCHEPELGAALSAATDVPAFQKDFFTSGSHVKNKSLLTCRSRPNKPSCRLTPLPTSFSWNVMASSHRPPSRRAPRRCRRSRRSGQMSPRSRAPSRPSDSTSPA